MDAAPDDFKESKCFIISMNEEREKLFCVSAFYVNFFRSLENFFMSEHVKHVSIYNANVLWTDFLLPHITVERKVQKKKKKGEVEKFYCFFFLLTAVVIARFRFSNRMHMVSKFLL